MCDQGNGLSHAKTSNSDDVTLPDDLSVSDDSESEEEPGRGPCGPGLRDLNPFDDDDEDDDDDEGEGEVQLGAAHGAQSCFSLKGGSSSFSSRSLSIFSCLDSVAPPPSAAPSEDRAGAGTFARPSRPPPKAVPDYLLHPERWTRYSLEDVPETSERQNSAAAREFLSSLQHRKQQQLEPPDSSCSSQHKVVFSRPSGRQGRERHADEQKTATGREMNLSHLEEEEEEEEGGEGGSASTRRSSEVKEKNTKKVKERGGAVGRLDQEDKDKEEVKAPVKPPEAEERKRTWEQRGGALEEREEENQQASAGFVSFRKSNRKNYRRSSEQDDS